MAIKNLKTIYQIRRDTEANWLAVKDTCIPYEGEPCLTLDGEHKGQMKIGDGISTWGKLKYYVCDAKIPDDVVRFAGIVDELPEASDYEVGSYCICKGQLYVRDANGWTAPKADAILRVINIYGDSTSENTSVEVDGKTYDTMAEAIEALPEGGTLKLTGGLAKGEMISVDKKVTLDMNSAVVVDNENTPVTIGASGDLTLTGNGKVECNKNGKPAVDNKGKLTIEDGNYTRTIDEKGNTYYTMVNHGDLTINGGIFQAPGVVSSMIENGYWEYSKDYVVGEMSEYPSLTINGGTFINDFYVIKNDDNGKLYINDGNFYGTIFNNGYEMIIKGGNFDIADGTYNIGMRKLNDSMNSGNLIIEGGTFTSNGTVNMKVNDGDEPKVIIRGGKFSAKIPVSYLDEGYKQSFIDGYYVVSKA